MELAIHFITITALSQRSDQSTKMSGLGIQPAMDVRRNFSREGKVDILLIFSTLLAMQRKWTYTKNFQCYGNSYTQCFPYKKILH